MGNDSVSHYLCCLLEVCEASHGREDEAVSHISGEVWSWPVELDQAEGIEGGLAGRGIVFLEASEGR